MISQKSILILQELDVINFRLCGISTSELIISVNIIALGMTLLWHFLFVSVIEVPVNFNIRSAYIWQRHAPWKLQQQILSISPEQNQP